MAQRAAKCTVGIQGNSKNTYRGDTISANIQERGGHSNRGRAHKLEGEQSR